MGTVYTIACRGCRVRRDLDKLWHVIHRDISTIAEASEVSRDAIREPYRLGLMGTFLHKHQGHEVVFYGDHLDLPIMDEVDEYPEDGEFWIRGEP